MAEVRPKKRLGQNFLAKEEVAERIAKLVVGRKNVLEIGPGLGALTDALTGKAEKLTAVEIDSELVSILRKKKRRNVVIKHSDALTEDFSQYDAVVGLLPYNISSQLIERFVRSKCPYAVFVVQKELGDRMVALPGSKEYSRFSVLCQNNCHCSVLETYPPTFFWPEPSVQSSLVEMRKKTPLKISDALVNALFQHKNQKVKKALKHSRHLIKLREENFGAMAEKKVVTLSIKELVELSKSLD